MSSEELRLINAVFGFCVRMRGSWPRPLVPLGYVPCGVEWELKVLLDGRDRTVRPDFICASGKLHHALCIEAKSATVKEEQARKYLAVTSLSLLNSVALPQNTDARRLTHDVLYLASQANTEKVVLQLTGMGVALPVVGADEHVFTLVWGEVGQAQLQNLFTHGIQIDVTPDEWPTHFVPFNSRSSLGEIVPTLSGALSRRIIAGGTFTLEELAADAVRHCHLCGKDEKKALREKIKSLVEDGRRKELKGYYDRVASEPAWRTVRDRITPPNQTRTLTRSMVAFVQRVQRGSPYAFQAPLSDAFMMALEAPQVGRMVDDSGWEEQ